MTLVNFKNVQCILTIWLQPAPFPVAEYQTWEPSGRELKCAVLKHWTERSLCHNIYTDTVSLQNDPACELSNYLSRQTYSKIMHKIKNNITKYSGAINIIK